jgi:predicted dehydrogenase
MRVGIIGCGGISRAHARAVAAIPSARLVAGADIVPERLEAAKQSYGGIDGYLDYHELLARDDIDVVCVCTPSGLHGQVAIDAAKAKKHVMTEKPLDVNLEQADAMIKAAKENGVKLSVIFQNRFRPMVVRAKQMIEEGRLGDILLASGYVKWYRTQEYYDSGLKWRGTLALDGGGALINQAVHTVDLLQWMVGPVASVTAQKATVAHKIEGEDIALGLFKYRNGAMGVFEASTVCYPGSAARVEIHGTKGGVTVDGDKMTLGIKGEEKSEESEAEASGVSADPLALSAGMHAVQLSRFFEAIREDKEPDPSGEEGRKALEIIVAFYQSADTGKPVALPLRD